MYACTELPLVSTDGLRIASWRWQGVEPVRGVIQIAHGMGEHIGRYACLIDTLASRGLTVYGNDHRGHGKTAVSSARLGDFGEGGFDLLVEDMVELSRIAKQQNPGQPFLLFGHSMGSFAAQQYVLDHSDEIDGLILSGTGALDGLAQIANTARSEKTILNAKFEPGRTPLDWLSRDSGVVDAFISDPLCFAQLQPKSFASFLAAAPRLSDRRNLSGIERDLPIYLFSGSEDPVGQQLQGVQTLIARYRKAGLRDITQQFYPGGRHEMLNETNSDQVRDDLLSWIFALLERRAKTLRLSAAVN